MGYVSLLEGITWGMGAPHPSMQNFRDALHLLRTRLLDHGMGGLEKPYMGWLWYIYMGVSKNSGTPK